MGLGDLFKSKPKKPNYEKMIKSSDWRERKEAAEMISDETILKEVYLNDDDPRVRAAAILNPNLQDEKLFQQAVLKGREQFIVNKIAEGQNAGLPTLVEVMIRYRDKKFVEQVYENNTSGVGHVAEKMLKGQRMYIDGEYITITL